MTDSEIDEDALQLAHRWCAAKGEQWSVRSGSGSGGTSSVFVLDTPEGDRALKVLIRKFSEGELGNQTEKRIELEKKIGVHDCPYLVKIYDGGRFEGRLFVLMSKAPGTELEKCLRNIPRSKVRVILDQITQACEFLRSKGICHRDIKSANVFVSDDFDHATLLDLSVSRSIQDSVGMGTDHDGQLPVVATSRYSPPEYLFRLVEPSPELWHALDIYQLGGLLHDLLMREPMFEAQYKQSQDNRYRFAWIVATIDPEIIALDADQDLVLLARRALDKDFKRRSLLQLEDFSNDTGTRRAHGLAALGLGGKRVQPPVGLSKPDLLRRVTDVTKSLDNLMSARLYSEGVTANHAVSHGPSDTQKVIELKWALPTLGNTLSVRDLCFRITVGVRAENAAIKFTHQCELHAVVEGKLREAQVALPDIVEQTEIAEALCDQSVAALGDLARDVLRAAE